MNFFLKEKIRTVPKYIWILLAITFVGIFFRTYNFHDWLLFESDQARDATLIEQVIANEKPWPLLGPTMRASSDTKETLFRTGPIYYYFQILSASIFGAKADVMAYPDLFFGILSIPILFYFFKRYFINNVSLLLTGLYTISYFAIRYSRFAWNPNPIPFFVILFLLSLHELLVKKEKTSWFWVSICGMALGVGVQLHATMLLLLSSTWGIVTIYLFVKKKALWKKLLVVLFLAILINSPQIVSEWQTGFANSRALFRFSGEEDSALKKRPLLVVADAVSCHIENNIYVLSSLGEESCIYSYVKVFENNRVGNKFRETVPWFLFSITFLFSVIGYFLLGYRFYTEQDENKKYFLGLIILFSIFFFILMLPIIGAGFKEFRYFSPVFFVPLIFFGIMIDFLYKKHKEACLFAVVLMSTFIIVTNLDLLFTMATRLSDQKGNNGHTVFLGEIENIVVYMKDNLKSSKKIYVMSEKLYTGNIALPGEYIAKQYGYEYISTSDLEKVPQGSVVFFLAENSNDNKTIINGIPVKNVKNFGAMRVYQLEYE